MQDLEVEVKACCQTHGLKGNHTSSLKGKRGRVCVCVCVSVRAPLCWSCVRQCVCVCVAARHLLVESAFVCLFVRNHCWCVRVCVAFISVFGYVDLLVLSSSTCVTVSLPHTCLGGEKRFQTLLVVSGLWLACLGLFGVGMAHARSNFHWSKQV